MERFVASAEKSKQALHPTMSDIEKQPPLALRIFRPALPLRVRVAEGRPVSMTAVAKQTSRGELQEKILWSAGPWRSSGDWWTENAKEEAASQDQAGAWDREEWDVALANGDGNSVTLYRIYRDQASGQWFADASYD